MNISIVRAKFGRLGKDLLAGVLAVAISGVLGFVAFRGTPKAEAAWFSTGGTWNYRQKITIDHTKVSGSDQTDFPVLIKLTDANNPVFAKAQSSGADIRFAASNETTRLSHEIENFVVTSGSRELDVWVKIPVLSHSLDTVVFMYYGNVSAVAPSAVETQAVWSNGYAGVWHLSDTSGGFVNSANNTTLNGTAQGSPTYASGGIIANSVAVSSSSPNGVKVANNALLDPGANDFTVDGWIFKNYSSSGWSNAGFLSKWSTGASPAQCEWLLSSSTNGSDDNPAFSVVVGTTQYSASSSSSISLNNWHHLVGTRRGTSLYLYVDGNYAGTMNIGTVSINATVNDFYMGYFSTAVPSVSLNGKVDNVNYSSVGRSDSWIATEYVNQNAPTSFYSFNAEAIRDSIVPTNPTSISGKSSSDGSATLSSGSYYNYPTPYFEWSGAVDIKGPDDFAASGISGYYSYFGTSCGIGGGDPTQSRGVLPDTGGGLHFSADSNVTIPDLSTNEGDYCLRIRTADNGGNINPTVWEAYSSYKYEITPPMTPGVIAVNPAGYTTVDSFDFNWPVVGDIINANASGLAGYQYMRGDGSGDTWSATITDPGISNIKSYQVGENIFLLRTLDNAGNLSNAIQTTYYFSDNQPSKPTNLTADPDMSDVNSFSFHWTAPVHTRPIVDYGYIVNNTVLNEQNIIWTGSGETTLSADHFAARQGVNTLYLIAKDDSGAYSTRTASVASVSFNCTSVAPPIPSTVSVTDSSDRLLERYMLTLQWKAGSEQSKDSFSHYSVERSVDGITYAEIATPTSTAYIDASALKNDTLYYYRVKSVDNAGAVSAASAVVSKVPTGKFTTPPAIVTEPAVSAKSSNATITWVVNRASTASVRFGTDMAKLSASQISTSVETAHAITLVGLTPGTRYYYQVQSLDAFRDYSLESAYSSVGFFDTMPSPSIANVLVSNITLNSADVTWETTSASNTKSYYGTSISYGFVLPEADTSMTTQHSVKLQNLADTTRYHFKIFGDDIDGNTLSGDDYVFDTLPKPLLNTIEYAADLSGPAPVVNISWLSNVPTTSSVEYTPQADKDGVAFEESQSALVSRHKVTLSNLMNNTNYKFTVSGVDQFGNKAVSDLQILKTNADTRPPAISGITVESSNVGSGDTNSAHVIVAWQTDELGTSQVSYDEGLSGLDYRKSTPPDAGLITNHVVVISGLKPGTPYHFQVLSKDEGGNLGVGADQAVITGQVTQSVFTILSATFNNLFGWIGNF